MKGTAVFSVSLLMLGIASSAGAAGVTPDPVSTSSYTASNGILVHEQQGNGATALSTSNGVTLSTGTTPDGQNVASAQLVPPSMGKIEHLPGVASAVDQVIAMGMEPSEAFRVFGSISARAAAVGGPSVVAQDPRATTPRAAAPAPSSNGSYYTTYCASVQGGLYNLVKAYGCDVVYLDYNNGAGTWYMADEVTSSGSGHDPNPRMTGLRFLVNRYGGQYKVRWSPDATFGTNCNVTRTFSITSPQTGLSYSTSEVICSGSLSPEGATTNATFFGSHWSGSTGNAVVAADSTSLWVSPPGSPASASPLITIWW